MWGPSWLATTPDGGFFLGIGCGPNADASNDAPFALPAFERLLDEVLQPWVRGYWRHPFMRDAWCCAGVGGENPR